MYQLAEMVEERPMQLHDGVVSTTTDVWAALAAAKTGDLKTIELLRAKCEALLWCQYDYTTPMQFAVREGHFEVVKYLIQHTALDSEDRNHPFLEPLATLAEDRNYVDIAEHLRESFKDTQLVHRRGDTGKIDHGRDIEQKHFQAVVERGNTDEAEKMLRSRPDLAQDELAFWGEGILAVPCNHADRHMIDLLLNHGATVPRLSKWGARYYFKHYDIAKFLLQHGMDPNHSNWRGFTLLHEMAFTGDVEKSTLLIDHGADIDGLDDEYHSTPLGYAAHFGNHRIVKLLLDRGGDVNKAGKPWATPLAHSRIKASKEIEVALIQSGAE